MDSVIKQVSGFFTGLTALFLAVIPVLVLWTILTGGAVFGMDVAANLTTFITRLGDSGFVGLVVLVLLASFFTKK